MINVALVSVIRRWHFREGRPIRDIARRTGLSRNTVRKYLNAKDLDPKYPSRNSPSKLDDDSQTLTSWLHRESRRHRKQRKTVKTLYADLQLLGYEGSYDRVAAFSRQWRQEQYIAKQQTGKQAYIPLRFAPGEAFQFDWGDSWAVIAGNRIKLQVAHFKLSSSRAFFLRAYLTQTHEMLFDAHNHAFRVLGGVPERGIYDNMKTAVDKVGRGKQRTVNRRFQTMVSHNLFEADFCNAAAGWEKGQVEKVVQDARNGLWQNAPTFNTLAELNDWLEQQCKTRWQQTKHPEQSTRTVADVWLEERLVLMPKPVDFDGYVETMKRVSSTCLINFERTRYSVPASFANCPVSVHAYPDRLVVIAEGVTITEHSRVFNRDHGASSKTIYNWRHYLAVVQRKPGALRNGAPFDELPDSFKALQKILLRRLGGDREMADILALVLQHSEADVALAVDEALKAETPSKQHVVNCLNRQVRQAPSEPLITPETLTLSKEKVTFSFFWT